MTMSRRVFTREFKKSAVKLVLEQGLSITQAAKDLGIGSSSLDRWVRDVRLQNSVPNALTESQRDELIRLRKENQILKMERDLLKKTAIFFAKEKP
jgi:transposase